MSGPYEAQPTLTDEQQAVVDQPADALLLVTAGAGAGKTHTLVRRLEALIMQKGLRAGEILVLSFSRAAVRELRERLARHGDAARYVRAQTFDSWALDVLCEVSPDTDWRAKSFDERIRAATQAISTGDADGRYEADLAHVVIDEVQDLVGDRRELVEALLDRYDCGFTVVGDPAQAIYGFQIKDLVERKGETNRFFDWLRATFGEDLVELRLDRNFRARTEEARLALHLGPRLQVGLSEPETYERLRDVLGDTLHFGNLTDASVCAALREYEGTSAILCRTNGQALLCSELLHAGGVPHRLQRTAQDRAVPAWLNQLFRPGTGSQLSRKRFDELTSSLEMDLDLVWRLLGRAGSTRGNDRSLDLARLRTAIATNRLPDELTTQPASSLVVSSFHRAKGLEFGRVLVLDPGALWEDSDTHPAEEARMLYVAMTRPRDELWHLTLKKTPPTGIKKKDVGSDRWSRYHWTKKYMRLGLELLGDDVHTDHPAGALIFHADPVELQTHLATKVLPGDEVVLECLDDSYPAIGQSPIYLVVHADRPIGVMSDRFSTDLYRYMQRSAKSVPKKWPLRIIGARIEAVETVAGGTAAGSTAGLGEHGVWLAPRLTGLTWFDYGKTKETDDA